MLAIVNILVGLTAVSPVNSARAYASTLSFRTIDSHDTVGI